MTLEARSNLVACASLICSASFWLGAVLSLFPSAPRIDISGTHWLEILGVGIVLAVVAGVLNFERKLWIFAIILAVPTFALVMYANFS